MVENLTLGQWVQEKSIVSGLITIHKPYGIPSTALTDLYKRSSGLKVGHGGTLDPLAEGAMMLGIGSGTKLLSKYLESEKRYKATILIGATNDAGDLELPLTFLNDKVEASNSQFQSIYDELSSGYTQELPALNATKQKGKTTYSLVREGKEVEKRYVETKILEWITTEFSLFSKEKLAKTLHSSIINLHSAFEQFYVISDSVGYYGRKYSFMLEKWQNNIAISVANLQKTKIDQFVVLEIDVRVPKGMYIRALANDIAIRFGSKGVLLKLERVNAGNY